MLITGPRRTRDPTASSVSGCSTGSGRSSIASVTLNIATFAPVPNAIETTAMAASPGLRANTRMP